MDTTTQHADTPTLTAVSRTSEALHDPTPEDVPLRSGTPIGKDALQQLEEVTRFDGEDGADVAWFAVHVLHNRVFRLEEWLAGRGVHSYLPTEEVVVRRGEAIRRMRRPMVPSLIFIRLPREKVGELERAFDMPAYVYKRRRPDGSRVPAEISDAEMRMFILVSSSGEQGLEFFDASQLDLSVGMRVRVTGGIFKGCEGSVKRIRGNRRFVVTINGVCAVATPYIPRAFLEPMP